MKKIILFLSLIFFVEYSFSQTIPQVNLPLLISDGVKTKILYFGLDPTATNGIDAHLDEMEQPPLPPSGIFDARFIGYDINIPELGEGVLKDFRNGSDTTKGQQIHELRYQPGNGTTITIKWNLPSGVTGLLQDFFGGIVVNKQMSGKDSLVVTNPGILNKLKMTITYNLNGISPSAPNLISPANGSININLNPTLQWTRVSGSILYNLQISKDSNFTLLVLNDSSIQTNLRMVQLEAGTKYFWRVRAKNNSGWGTFSSIWNFSTTSAIPLPPKLHTPQKGAFGISIPVEFKWYSSLNSENYTLLIGEDSSFSNPVINEIIFDTVFSTSNLQANRTYFWKVIANNLSGSSSDSEIWYFTTLSLEVELDELQIDRFLVKQNFPNPFNSTTTISYQLPVDSFVKFKVYDISGKEIFSLDLGYQSSGNHRLTINFSNLLNAKSFSSGVYFYKISTDKFSQTKKMIYLK